MTEQSISIEFHTKTLWPEDIIHSKIYILRYLKARNIYHTYIHLETKVKDSSTKYKYVYTHIYIWIYMRLYSSFHTFVWSQLRNPGGLCLVKRILQPWGDNWDLTFSSAVSLLPPHSHQFPKGVLYHVFHLTTQISSWLIWWPLKITRAILV